MEVGSADDAFGRAEANDYDLVLCDVTFGETRGGDCFRALIRMRLQFARRSLRVAQVFRLRQGFGETESPIPRDGGLA